VAKFKTLASKFSTFYIILFEKLNILPTKIIIYKKYNVILKKYNETLFFVKIGLGIYNNI
jgi:hypothetical protein